MLIQFEKFTDNQPVYLNPETIESLERGERKTTNVHMISGKNHQVVGTPEEVDGFIYVAKEDARIALL